MNKYSKQKLNERTKNTAKQTNRINATFYLLFYLFNITDEGPEGH